VETFGTFDPASRRLALQLRRAGKSVILIHHAGKSGRQRGTSRKEDVLDTIISLRRPPDYSPDQGARFEVYYEKSLGF
jgi:putative DNA primase/helicase